MRLSAPVLGLDIETYSVADISDGAPAYAEHPSTGVHCVCGAWLQPDGRITDEFVWTPGTPVPAHAVRHVVSGGLTCAHNAGFEAAILRYVLRGDGWPEPTDDQWLDTAAIAAVAGLPSSLEGLGQALGLPVQKDMAGAATMKRLMVFDARNGPPDVEQADRDALARYCGRDVDVMLHALLRLPDPGLDELTVQIIDRRINMRGLPIDLRTVATMQIMVERRLREIDSEAAAVAEFELLGVSKSATGLKHALLDMGLPLASLDRGALAELLARPNLPDDVRRLLELRTEGSRRTSLAKLLRVPASVNTDGRLRQAMRYCGAHTGRWASGGLQVHNLPRARKAPGYDADALAAAIARADYDAALRASPDLLRGLSWQLRSIIVAPPGREFLGGDFSAIEARVVGWLAGQQDLLDLFAAGDREVRETGKRTTDVYVEDARRGGSDDRQFGKLRVLGLGYGMSAIKMQETAAAQGIKLSVEQAYQAVREWRERNSLIVQLWRDLEDAVHASIADKDRDFRVGTYLKVRCNDRALCIRLPSGRVLRYWRPRTALAVRPLRVAKADGTIETRDVELRELRFWTPAPNRRDMIEEGSYGGKLVENVTQAFARDLLAAALVRLELAGYPVVLHVHDSITAEVASGTGSEAEFADIMATSPYPNLPLFVDPYRGRRFKG